MTPFDCPRCGVVLTMSDRHGIEIDYCPQCRGVWLDRNELDKVLERATIQAAPAAQPPSAPPAQQYAAPAAGGWTQPATPPQGWTPPPQHSGWQPRHDDDDWDDRRRSQSHHGKPRKHWLSELFD
jgi:Zn-finger nucleic acid-binding protein